MDESVLTGVPIRLDAPERQMKRVKGRFGVSLLSCHFVVLCGTQIGPPQASMTLFWQNDFPSGLAVTRRKHRYLGCADGQAFCLPKRPSDEPGETRSVARRTHCSEASGDVTRRPSDVCALRIQ